MEQINTFFSINHKKSPGINETVGEGQKYIYMIYLWSIYIAVLLTAVSKKTKNKKPETTT